MQSLENALARERLRTERPDEVKVVVRSLNDIQRIVSEYDPSKNVLIKPITISSTVNVVENETNTTYKVDAETQSQSRRDLIIEALSLIKKRETLIKSFESSDDSIVDGVVMKPAKIWSGSDGIAAVDPIIKTWFGGYRDGVLICWDFGDNFIYKYDIFDHKLSRTSKS